MNKISFQGGNFTAGYKAARFYLEKMPKSCQKIMDKNLINPIKNDSSLNLKMNMHPWNEKYLQFFLKPDKQAGRCVFLKKEELINPVILQEKTKDILANYKVQFTADKLFNTVLNTFVINPIKMIFVKPIKYLVLKPINFNDAQYIKFLRTNILKA